MVVTDPTTGSTTTGTISILDPKTFATQELAVGLAPSNLALSPDGQTLAVANGHSDSLSLIDTATRKRTDVAIPTWPGKGIGSQPIALVFAPDGKRLYVACGGNNAVAILTRSGKQWKVSGAVPTGWFPSALEIDGNGALRVLNIKGTGNTANKTGSFSSLAYIGTLSQIPAVTDPQIAAGTREVAAANSPKFESAGGVEKPSQLGIEHVIFIIKENRTYDQILGDIARGNGDPKLVQYGRDITPNHHALAERYVLLDNFRFCTLDDPSTLPVIDRIGSDRVMVEVDYPHSDTTWPDSQAQLRRRFQDPAAGLTADDIANLTHRTAARLFRAPLPAGVT